MVPKETSDDFKSFGSKELRTLSLFFNDDDGRNIKALYVVDLQVLQKVYVSFKKQVSTLVHVEHVIDFDNLKSMKQVFSSLIVQKYTWPTLFMLYNYALSMVLASVEDERSISLAKLIETDLRSLLTDEAKPAVGRIANCGLTASQFLESSLCEKAVDV